MAAMVIEKKVANATLYTNGMIRLEKVRVSFPHLDKPYVGRTEADKGKTPSYGIVAMLPKDTHEAAKNLVKGVIDKMLADNDAKVAADKKFLRNGDDQGRAEYEGHYTVSARERNRPTCRDKKGNLLDPVGDAEQIKEMFYGGCVCHVLIRPWFQDGQKVGAGFGKRINAGLVGVMFVKDGESFGEGRIDDSGAWDDVGTIEKDAVEEDDDDL